MFEAREGGFYDQGERTRVPSLGSDLSTVLRNGLGRLAYGQVRRLWRVDSLATTSAWGGVVVG